MFTKRKQVSFYRLQNNTEKVKRRNKKAPGIPLAERTTISILIFLNLHLVFNPQKVNCLLLPPQGKRGKKEVVLSPE